MKEGVYSKLDAIQLELRQEILRKDWKVGDKLPTEVELAHKFGCSVGTVNKAVSLLVHEGLIERRPRLGTRVISNSVSGGGIRLEAYAYICPSDQHEGIWRAMRGFQSVASEKKRRMLMLTFGDNYQKEVEIVGRLSEFDVQGAVLYPLVPSFDEWVNFSRVLAQASFPIVLVGVGLPGQAISGVSIDGFHAGYTVTRHLIERGHRRIGFLSARSWAVSMRDRYQGYKWALSEAGLSEDARWVRQSPSMRVDYENPLHESMELAGEYLAQVESDRPQAVVCGADYVALGLTTVAQARGLSVPRDLAVTGVDDYAQASAGPVRLTTYRVPYEEMGRQAFELLESVVQDGTAATVEKRVRGELIVRDSA